jgi:copper homeostasis protein
MNLEITVNSIESALLAQSASADRIELCANFPEGGTTPSKGMIEVARKKLHIPLFVLIRPRGGDFLYSDTEFEVMKEDIRYAREAGADGVVLGLLHQDGNMDVERTTSLVAMSRPMQVTFHRAFDLAADPFVAMEDIIRCGADRILTSGQAPTAEEGSPLIAKLIRKAGDRIIIMPGSGINENNITDLALKTGATEFHASLRKQADSKMQFRRKGIQMGLSGYDDYVYSMTDPEKVLMIKKIVQ